MTRKYTRRDWLQTIGIASTVTAGVSLAGCSGQEPSDGSNENNAAGSGGTPTASTGGGGGGSKTKTVEMTDELKFDPGEIEVPVGTTVTWKNASAIGHTVTAYEGKLPDGAAYFASGGFDSEAAAKDGYPETGNIEANGTFEHTFETKGTYEYYCIPHEMNGMVGTVRVV